MATAAPPVYVETVASLNPPRYGLLSAAELVPTDGDSHWRNGVEFVPSPTGPATLQSAECLNTSTGPLSVPDGLPTTQAAPIIVYGGFKCRSVGLTDEIIDSRARSALAGGEIAATESALWGTVSTGAFMDGTTVVLGGGSAVSLVAGLGLLEQYMYTQYGGTPVIHAPRRVAPVAAERRQIVSTPQKLTTVVGSGLVFGNYPGTSPTGTAPAAGQTWIVATGQIQVRRSDVAVHGGDMASGINYRTNEVFAVARRTYVVSFDAIKAAVLVTI